MNRARDDHEAIIDRFLRKRAAVLAKGLQTGDLLMEFYAEEVIESEEKERLRVKRDTGAATNTQLSEALLAMLDTKPFEQKRKFIEVVHQQQPALVKEVVDSLQDTSKAKTSSVEEQPMDEESRARVDSQRAWRKAVHDLASQINTFQECTTLAVFLDLAEDFADPVQQLRSAQPTATTRSVASQLFEDWLKNNSRKPSAEKKAVLSDVLENNLRRKDLAEFLDELIKDE